HSSYPHELLHNWWGNGVTVDGKTGNWCEGITSYMADHLIAEQRGQGDDYRRTTLQKFTDYVTPANDFPLTKFRGRTDAPSEAVGYGKCMMMCNMLRDMLGDAVFVKAWQKFYRDNRFRAASFADVRAAFEAVSGRDLAPFFRQWVERTGAPELRLEEVVLARSADGWKLDFTLRQVQAEDAFALEVPVALTFAEKTEIFKVAVDGRERTCGRILPERPLRIQVDPQFQLFRRLHPGEVPPSLSRVFGAGKVLVLLPSRAEGAMLEAWRALAAAWAKDETKKITVALDRDVAELPADSAVWAFGGENLHEPLVRKGLAGLDAALEDGAFRLGASRFDRKTHSLVVAVRHPGDPASVLVLLAADRPDACPGLGRKLPHYGRYGALVFEGAEPANVAKAAWPAEDSPLSRRLGDAAASAGPELPRRPALARLAPVFSAERMAEHVKFLASEALEGRAPGTPGIEQAAAYIAEKFKAAGLEPGGDEGTYFQTFEGVTGPGGRKGPMRNVIGILPGTKPEWKGRSAVVCAHYDHLGRGWPDVHEGDAGKVHPGADDDASGVAVLLELAEILGKNLKPDRTLVFAAFTGEESGLQGSRRYVKNAGAHPASGILGALNLDTVGRLGAGKILVIDGGSAREWRFVFMGCGYVTGVESEMAAEGIASGDQAAFLEAGVPAVQLFTGAHGDTHRPSDTADKIDGAGLAKVASFAREAVLFLASRPEPLTFQGAGATVPKPPAGPGAGGERRATTGCMPDFAFKGPGVRVASVGKDSPAEKAGLAAGDVIVRIAGKEVPGLREYSEALKAFKPGDEVEIAFLRDGTERKLTLTLTAR
ncbi:MAG: M20/M25/M40 family metallo-hydrolase, partial [Planctomycetes bacterium]|nr:M20/M25/M40 family metallo-hydrolase [Planctomycetota bacterium]